MPKEVKSWRILVKQKTDEIWEIEKFMTGEKIYYSFQEAQHDKNALRKMVSSMNFKVVRNLIN